MDDYNKKIGETFAKYRKEKGYSQQYVADRMGVSKATVHNWEKGKRQMRRYDRKMFPCAKVRILRAFCGALCCLFSGFSGFFVP